MIGDEIFISRKLLRILTPRERKVLLAHEVSHWQHKDNIKMFFIKTLLFMFPYVINYLQRQMEIRADREAIEKTKDIEAFKTLLSKLHRSSKCYPSNKFSLTMADKMAGKI